MCACIILVTRLDCKMSGKNQRDSLTGAIYKSLCQMTVR